MIVRLIIRRGDGPGLVTLRTDFKAESLDTPRIGKLGLDIKAAIDNIVKKCEDDGEVAI